MEKPKISVIIPVYNSAHALPRCLDSVINQTCGNLEIILIDDGSPDNSGAICDAYASRDDRIRVLHQKNSGAAAARNAGLAAAAGEWIGFVDSDDYIEPDQYAYLLDMARRHGADIAQCGAFSETGDRSEVEYLPDAEICIDTGRITEACPFFSGTVWSRIFRHKAVEGLTFNPDFIIGEDLHYNLRALSGANKTVFGAQAKYHYVRSADSLCNAKPTQASLVSIRNALLRADAELANCKPVRDLCRALLFRNDLDMCSKIVRCGMERENTGLVGELRDELRGLCRSRFAGSDFSGKEKIKAFLIARSWTLYKRTLYALKGDFICQHPNI